MTAQRCVLELINPDGLPTPQSYTHVIAATGSRLVFVAGQLSEDAQGDLVGSGDLAAQAQQAFANVGKALAAAGATPEQVAKITIYVVGHRPDTCRPSRRLVSRCSATTGRRMSSWESRRCSSPGT